MDDARGEQDEHCGQLLVGACGTMGRTGGRRRTGGGGALAAPVGDDDLVTGAPLRLRLVGLSADGVGVPQNTWDEWVHAGEAIELAQTLHGLARLEDEVLSV